MSVFSKLIGKIALSIDGTTNKASSARIQSYIMMSLVMLSTLSFLIIEVWNAVFAWSQGKPYILSNEIVIVFGMLLSHHIAILFNRNKANVPNYNEGLNLVEAKEEAKPEKKKTNVKQSQHNNSTEEGVNPMMDPNGPDPSDAMMDPGNPPD